MDETVRDLAKEEYLRACGGAVRRAQVEMDLSFFGNVVIDEVSLLFGEEHSLDEFVVWAGEVGLDYFNSTRDIMKRIDDLDNEGRSRSSFEVRFEFLRVPNALWRIEAMAVLSGSAPLHSAALEVRSPRIIHASYKLPSPTAYRDNVMRMGKMFGGRAAAYENSYGQFSYFGDRPMYYKPRINLRDS